MKIAGYNISKVKNLVIPDTEVKTKAFSYQPTPAVVVDANVKEYKSAFIAAHGKYSQQRTKIYDIYQNALDFDGHLSGLIKRRLLNTSGKVFQYVVNDEQSARAQEVIESPLFAKMVDEIIMSKFWGMALLEFANDKGLFDFDVINIKHIDPFQKKVRKEQSTAGQNDKSYDKLKNVAFLGDGNDFGLLQQLALLAMYKRAALGDWAQYSQLAGTNFRTVKYRGDMPDNVSRRKIRDVVNNAGSGTLDLPANIDVETSNQTSSSQNQLFENYVKYLDDQMTKIVLGQTMTTEDGSSRSQAEVHERTQEDIFDADGKYVLDVLNYEMSEIFASLYGIAGGKWKFVESATQAQADEIERDLKLKELGVVFTDAELRQKYGLTAQTPTL